MKRLFDITISLISLIILSPILIIIGLLIQLTSPGPIFYRQERIGLNGRVFKIFKFRSMITEADKVGPYHTQVNDVRITSIGKLLRRSSIDELPQLLNIIIGDMSVIGPRPNVEAQKSLYKIEEWNKRNSVKPGLSGLAQATVRSSATHDERTRLDLEYIDNNSFIFDIKIIIFTIKQLFLKGGY